MGVESELSWYQQAEDVLAGAAVAVQRRECVDVEVVSRLARYLVDAIRGNDRLVVVALSSPPGSPQITNLINVGILGTKIGLGLGFYGTELHHLALAALLHDIGVFALSPELMSKDGRFTGAERAVLEEHPRLGAEIIERLGGSIRGWRGWSFRPTNVEMGKDIPIESKGERFMNSPSSSGLSIFLMR